MSYDPAFFDLIRPGCQRSAEVVVPLVLDVYAAGSVIDVGCGEGWWAHEFHKHGCDAYGVDGDYIRDADAAHGVRFHFADLSESYSTPARYDLAVSLEVAEHLPPERAEGFVADLCRLAPVVVFSAAIPGQGGVSHLNEQWPAYWVDLFERNGYACSGALRWEIWNDDRVENWYAQNLIVAAREPDELPEWFDTPLAPVFPVVHPALFDARRS